MSSRHLAICIVQIFVCSRKGMIDAGECNMDENVQRPHRQLNKKKNQSHITHDNILDLCINTAVSLKPATSLPWKYWSFFFTPKFCFIYLFLFIFLLILFVINLVSHSLIYFFHLYILIYINLDKITNKNLSMSNCKHNRTMCKREGKMQLYYPGNVGISL